MEYSFNKPNYFQKINNVLELDQFTLTGIAGSTRHPSYSTKVLNMVLDEAKRVYGISIKVIDLNKIDIPIYKPNNTEIYSENILKDLLESFKWSDAFILSSPDYHGSMSGAIKNFLDYFWEEFAGKTFGYVVASHEKGLTVADQMRTAIRQCYGWSMPYNISINGQQDFNSNGEIINPLLQNRINMLARDIVFYGKLIRKQFLQDVINGHIQNSFAEKHRNYYMN